MNRNEINKRVEISEKIGRERFVTTFSEDIKKYKYVTYPYAPYDLIYTYFNDKKYVVEIKERKYNLNYLIICDSVIEKYKMLSLSGLSQQYTAYTYICAVYTDDGYWIIYDLSKRFLNKNNYQYTNHLMPKVSVDDDSYYVNKKTINLKYAKEYDRIYYYDNEKKETYAIDYQ